jgi:LacI family transcriptional regulator
MTNLEEIARLAGSSRSTVSRVINNDASVSETTRKRVEEVIRRMNYHPNRVARRLAGGRTHVLGLVIPIGPARLFSDPYFPALIQGVGTACNVRDYTMMLWLAEPEYERRIVGQIINSGMIDGVILSSLQIGDPIMGALLESGMPLTIIGRVDIDAPVSSVDVDNRTAAREAVDYLIRSGRRRVMTVGGPPETVVGIDRRDGYLDAMQMAGLRVEDGWVEAGDFSEAGGYTAALRLLAHGPEAIFAASDPMAFGALRALREAGRRTPQEVAVIGFDDIPAAAASDPPLTTMHQPVEQMGAAAVEMLITRLEQPASAQQRVILPTHLVVRASA